MDGDGFDRLTRTLSQFVSRRGFLSIVVTFIAGIWYSLAAARQSAASTCGESGEVCTHMMGCCQGLTCATSSINTSYGVCVTGSGAMTQVGTTLISPFDEDAAEQLAAMVAADAGDTSMTSYLDAKAQKEAEIDARKSEKKSKRATKRDKQRTRNDTQRSRRTTRRSSQATATPSPTATTEPTPTGTPRPTNTPQPTSTPRPTNTPTPTPPPPPSPPPPPVLELQLSNVGSDGAADNPETVLVTNRGTTAVILNKIESILSPATSTSFTTPIELEVGGSFLLLFSGPDVSQPDRIKWVDGPLCKADVEGDGFRIRAAIGPDLINAEFEVLCDSAVGSATIQSEVALQSGNAKAEKRDRKRKRREKHVDDNETQRKEKARNRSKGRNAGNGAIDNRDKNKNKNNSRARIEQKS